MLVWRLPLASWKSFSVQGGRPIHWFGFGCLLFFYCFLFIYLTYFMLRFDWDVFHPQHPCRSFLSVVQRPSCLPHCLSTSTPYLLALLSVSSVFFPLLLLCTAVPSGSGARGFALSFFSTRSCLFFLASIFPFLFLVSPFATSRLDIGLWFFPLQTTTDHTPFSLLLPPTAYLLLLPPPASLHRHSFLSLPCSPALFCFTFGFGVPFVFFSFFSYFLFCFSSTLATCSPSRSTTLDDSFASVTTAFSLRRPRERHRCRPKDSPRLLCRLLCRLLILS